MARTLRIACCSQTRAQYTLAVWINETCTLPSMRIVSGSLNFLSAAAWYPPFSVVFESYATLPDQRVNNTRRATARHKETFMKRFQRVLSKVLFSLYPLNHEHARYCTACEQIDYFHTGHSCRFCGAMGLGDVRAAELVATKVVNTLRTQLVQRAVDPQDVGQPESHPTQLPQ